MSTAHESGAAPPGGERPRPPGSAPGGRSMSVVPGRPARSPAADSDFVPIQVVTVELAEPLPAVRQDVSTSGVPYGCARVLVLLHDVPVGVVWLDLDRGEVAPSEVAEAVR